jgi:hypothetical protein
MNIKHPDGHVTEALILSRTSSAMRVVLKGCDDSTQLTAVNGAWFLEDREPVQLEFAWEKKARAAEPKADDCVCSAELASRLVDVLFGRSRVKGRVPEKRFAAGSFSVD